MIDVLSDEFFDEMKMSVKRRVSKKRFEHIKYVSKVCKYMAEVYGADAKKARLAGILHDWDKNLDNEEIQEKCRDLGIVDEVGRFVYDNMPQLLHGPTAAFELKKLYPDIPDDVLHAIYVHTTACIDMSDLDKILYVADAIEPNRAYDELRELQELVGHVSLHELYKTVYVYWTLKLVEHRVVLHPQTIEIYNDLVLEESGNTWKK